MKKWFWKAKGLFLNNAGVSTIEIILILVVLIALVLVFKNQILGLADTIFAQINKSAKNVY